MTATAGAGTSCSMSDPVRIDDTLWEIPADAREDMRVPARVFADADLLAAIRTDRSLEQLAERRDAPGDRRGRDRDAGHPSGLRLPGRRRSPRPRRRTASSPPAASATTSTAACGCSRPRSTHGELDARRRGALVDGDRAPRADRRGEGRAARAARGRARRGARAGAALARRAPQRGHGRGRAGHRVRGLPRGRRPGAGVGSGRASAAPGSSARSGRATTSSRSSASRS